MIDAIQDSIPMPVGSEASVSSGSKADSEGFSFTDALAALAGPGQKPAPTAEVDAQPTKADDPSAMLMGLAGAGAVQVASALPLPIDPPALQPDQGVTLPTATDAGQQNVVGANQPLIDALEIGQGFANPNPVGRGPGSGFGNPNPVGPEMAAVGVQLAQAGSVPVQVAPDQPVVLEASEPVTNPVQTTSGSLGIVAQLASEVAPQVNSVLQANAPVEQDDAVPKDDQRADSRPDSQVGKPGKSEKASVTETSVATAPSQVPLEAKAVTADRFNVQAFKRSDVQMTSVVQGSETKPSGGETNSSTGQQSPDPQAAVMGMQERFNVPTLERPNVQTAPDLHVRVIDQVVRQVSLQRIDGGSNLVVKLNPPDLGALRLQITQDATGMTTHIQTANSQVRGLLEAHMPLLMDSLAKAGVQMDSVSVSVGTSFNAFAQNARQQDAQPNAYQSRQTFANGRGTGGIQTIADAAMRSTWGSTRQAGYSWLA